MRSWTVVLLLDGEGGSEADFTLCHAQVTADDVEGAVLEAWRAVEAEFPTVVDLIVLEGLHVDVAAPDVGWLKAMLNDR